WQLRQGAQAEIIEEGLRRRIERRSSRRFTMTDDFDPLPVLERLHDVRGYGDAADGLNIAAGYGLLIGDDRQGFHDRTGISWRLFGTQSIQIRLHVGASLETPTGRDLHELDFATVPVLAQVVKQL